MNSNGLTDTSSETASGHTPTVYWITGLSAAGKTTLAYALADRLSVRNIPTAVLDGDELRKGLCADLGLSDNDRRENIRRTGEAARLMFNAGLTVICALISPFQQDREQVRARFPDGKFVEVYLAPPLRTCIERDPKGLYKKALDGQIQGMTGLDAPYEAPGSPEFEFDTSQSDVQQIVTAILKPIP